MLAETQQHKPTVIIIPHNFFIEHRVIERFLPQGIVAEAIGAMRTISWMP